MLYLGWVLAAFLFGVLLTVWALKRKKPVSLKRRFNAVDTYAGKTYAQVMDIAQTVPQATRRKTNGHLLRTWREGNYSISLLFDGRDVCLGVEDERK